MVGPKMPDMSRYLKDTYIPKMFRIRQDFPRPVIPREDIPGMIFDLLSDEKFAGRVRPGMRIAITAGSRGIANNDLTTKTIADWVKSRGASPFIVPAMGSHGGATAEGQAQIQYTGLAFYDGEWFYVVDGKLAADYTGNVEYDGTVFYVENGMVK